MMLPKDAVLPSIEDADNDDNEFMPEFMTQPKNEVLTKGQQYKSKHFKTNSSSSSSFGEFSLLSFKIPRKSNKILLIFLSRIRRRRQYN